MNNKYIKYFKYIIEHKKNITKAYKEYFPNSKKHVTKGLFHDLSKFSPVEFFAYANYFYGKKTDKTINDFKKATKHHYKHNKHHWNHWIGEDMKISDIEDMVVDWTAMGYKFGNTPQEYYLNNYFNFDMTYYTRMMTEYILGINYSPECNYGHTLYDFYHLYESEYFREMSENKYIVDKYNINLCDIFDIHDSIK